MSVGLLSPKWILVLLHHFHVELYFSTGMLGRGSPLVTGQHPSRLNGDLQHGS